MIARLRADIDAVMQRDPACPSAFSALTNYPGLWAVWWHRVTHRLHSAGWTWLARRISQCVRGGTGIEIHPGATIGARFFIDHGMGVVIGETTVIGDDVTIYQGVTLGGTGKEHGKRHPTLEDYVVVGVGATVLGDITIGRATRVGAGAVVVSDVPPHCTVVGVPGRVVVREGKRVETIDLHHEDLPDPIIEMYRALQRRMDRIEARLVRDEGIGAEAGERVFPVEDERGEDSDDDPRL
ncbi:MAG TPA: serine O-acetyltransferase [Coriobacteriia bacterium]|nr:MAG: Serine acetyltransferase [Actinobacteria bacterium 66_15]HAL29440.1 serine O-acetyltransferase [Coriobacteriia bacterium]